MTVAFVPLHPPVDYCRESKTGSFQRTSCSCRHRKGVTSIYGHIRYLSPGRSDITYVFHAPESNITTSRLSVTTASVRYCLNETSRTFHTKEPVSNERTVPPSLRGTLLRSPCPNFHNHLLVHPPNMRLESPSPRPL